MAEQPISDRDVIRNLERSICILAGHLEQARETITACQAENTRLVMERRRLEEALQVFTVDFLLGQEQQ